MAPYPLFFFRPTRRLTVMLIPSDQFVVEIRNQEGRVIPFPHGFRHLWNRAASGNFTNTSVTTNMRHWSQYSSSWKQYSFTFIQVSLMFMVGLAIALLHTVMIHLIGYSIHAEQLFWQNVLIMSPRTLVTLQAAQRIPKIFSIVDLRHTLRASISSCHLLL